MSRPTKTQWRELISQQQLSGLSAKDFCRRKSINQTYISLRKVQLTEAESNFITVTPSIPAANEARS